MTPPPSGIARLRETLRVRALKISISGLCRDAGADTPSVEKFIYQGGTLPDEILSNFAKQLLDCSYDPATDTLTSLHQPKVLPTAAFPRQDCVLTNYQGHRCPRRCWR